jgi:hypothetical protein
MNAKAVCVICLLATMAVAGLTENVFIVSIDGMRWQDGPATRDVNMPFLWDSLRPQGALYTQFINRGITVTNSGQSTIVTGVYQLLQNNAGNITPVRPREPTIGEYYRKYTGAPADKAVFISGKNTIWHYPVSTYPGYGYDYAPTIVLTNHSDTVTWDSAQAVIDRSHPKLCYVLFAEVDEAGHTADTSYYIGSIRRADSLVWLLWQKIQGDSIYRNKTTMIVTDDHGRHDDAHGGWQQHGDWCRGCRHVLFLAVGPDTKRDTLISLARGQTDIAPTVGYLLGFPTPFAQGTAMLEMINGYHAAEAPNRAELSDDVNLSHTFSQSRSCDIAINPHGLHVVYTDRYRGPYETWYTRSTDQGLSWTPPAVLFPYANLTTYTEPVIAAVGDSTLLAVAAGFRDVPEETTCVWMLSGRRSTNSGQTWDTLFDIDTLGTVTCKPAIATLGSRVNILTNHYVRLFSNLSRDGGMTFDSALGLSSFMWWHHSQWPSATIMDTTCFAVWQDFLPDSLLRGPFHNIWGDREPWSGTGTQLTTNGINSYSYQPWITSDDQQLLHIAYCNLPNASVGNLWQIDYVRSTDEGDSWTAPVNISGSTVGYQPVIKASSNGRLFCIWAAYEAGLWHLAGSFSDDHGLLWSAPFAITEPHLFSVEPRLAVNGNTLNIVWQDMRTGNWDIYFKQCIVAAVGADEPCALTGPDPPRPLVVHPQPACGKTMITLSLGPAPGRSDLQLFDAGGRLVRTWRVAYRPPETELIWDGTDSQGRPVGSGVYYLRLRTDRENVYSSRIVLVSVQKPAR